MIAVLRDVTYRRLFAAQVIALLGTGLLTVALGLLAFDIAGGDAGVVMGTAMALKMIAYVAVAPVANALAVRVSRRSLLIGADVARASVGLSLPFVTEAWQIYVLIFALQSASATFTPAFQAVIPTVLPDERDYTNALSLSRIAYDLESLASPMIAAALLTIFSYHHLFIGTVVGFIASAGLVLVAGVPSPGAVDDAKFSRRLIRGVGIFHGRSDLRALLAMNVVVASGTAMVIVNSAVLVRGELNRDQVDVALLLSAYGTGSMCVALFMPSMLRRFADRTVMLLGTVTLPMLLGLVAAVLVMLEPEPLWWSLVTLWLLIGAATSAVLTPSARLLRRNSDETSRPSVFAAQFAYSHACFLVTYPTAGFIGAEADLPTSAVVLGVLGGFGAVAALRLWAAARGQSGSGLSPHQ